MITSTISQYDSSTLTSAAYNYKHKTLTVHFNHGSYLYKDVEAADWNLFNLAESQGKALNQFIKGKYDYEKLNVNEIKTDLSGLVENITAPGSLLNELPPSDYQLDN
jgi:hypothetical protein